MHRSLKEFANDFTPVLNSKAARNIIREKARLKFDEEYEVLIKNLFDEPVIKSLVSPSVSEKLHNDLYKRSGLHIYPQIYIPTFQYLEDNGLMHRFDSTELPPVFVFYSGDPEVDSAQNNEVYPGYILVEGEFHFYTMVDEEYANENEVWVFSLNETVNEQARVPVS